MKKQRRRGWKGGGGGGGVDGDAKRLGTPAINNVRNLKPIQGFYIHFEKKVPPKIPLNQVLLTTRLVFIDQLSNLSTRWQSVSKRMDTKMTG